MKAILLLILLLTCTYCDTTNIYVTNDDSDSTANENQPDNAPASGKSLPKCSSTERPHWGDDGCTWDILSYVYGTVDTVPGGTVHFEGTIGDKGYGKLYGYCERNGDAFNFLVGHTDLWSLEDVFFQDGIPAYIEIYKVKGPPSVGVFELSDTHSNTPTPIDDDRLYTTLDAAIVATDQDVWYFDFEEADCKVELFATPAQGELIFDNDLNKSFDYYVRLSCSGPITGIYDEQLNSFNAEFYFADCV